MAVEVASKSHLNAVTANFRGDMSEDRDQFLRNAKRRALSYLDKGNVKDAIASMGSDLNRHPEFKGISNSMLPLGLIYAMNDDIEGARLWIVGFR